MAGLLEPEAQQPQQNLNNEQVAQLKHGYQIAQQMLYHKQIFDSLMGDLQKEPPVTVIARLIVMLLEKVQEGTQQQLDMVVATSLGIALLSDIADAVSQTGKIQVDEQMITEAFGHGVELWLQRHGSKYDQDELRGAFESMQQGAA